MIQKLTNFAKTVIDMAKSKKKNIKKVSSEAKKTAKPAAKKVVKPVVQKTNKPAAKSKPITKKAVKAKIASKKAIKPAPKKAVPQKSAKPIVKKVVSKKAIKKVAPKKAIKKAVPKKTIKKVAPKKTIKKVAPKPIAKKAIAKPAAKKTVVTKHTKPISQIATITKVVPKSQPVAVIPAPKPVSVLNKPSVKTTLTNKKSTKKGAKPTEMYDGKRVVRHELPAKALITLTKQEEEPVIDSPRYEFPTLRYSDKELKEFKEIIDKKLAGSREELTNLKDSLESHTDSQGGNKSWNMEEGSDSSEMEYLMNQISRLNKFIRDLEMALVRIENKTYGICRATGKLIDKQRLRVVPHATLSMEAKLNRKTDDIPNTSQAPAAHMGSEGESFAVEE